MEFFHLATLCFPGSTHLLYLTLFPSALSTKVRISGDSLISDLRMAGR
jgi:hypothetical protein